MPKLPEEHQKIIVRLRNGIDMRKVSHYGVSTAIFRATGISRMEADTDLVCPNFCSEHRGRLTEKESNAKKLLRITSISVNGKEHEVSVGAAMTQQGWVQLFKAGGGPILPARATWASRPPLRDYESQAGTAAKTTECSTNTSGNTRSAEQSAIERLVHREFEGRHKDELIDELAERYLPIHAGRVEAEDSVYEGEEQELRAPHTHGCQDNMLHPAVPTILSFLMLLSDAPFFKLPEPLMTESSTQT
ncbi:hypothetical protein HPB50_018050 [Hyalomma asiaticum]|uniref:Uncharacterized protein n=1 Tax=Hyalomma asiaticum TaxID=266040 RepID=A0ACB7TAV2_HYAAI|nr:hypothetical protein HPB50_018050 [Hyalomma asiaticum]